MFVEKKPDKMVLSVGIDAAKGLEFNALALTKALEQFGVKVSSVIDEEPDIIIQYAPSSIVKYRSTMSSLSIAWTFWDGKGKKSFRDRICGFDLVLACDFGSLRSISKYTKGEIALDYLSPAVDSEGWELVREILFLKICCDIKKGYEVISRHS